MDQSNFWQLPPLSEQPNSSQPGANPTGMRRARAGSLPDIYNGVEAPETIQQQQLG